MTIPCVRTTSYCSFFSRHRLVDCQVQCYYTITSICCCSSECVIATRCISLTIPNIRTTSYDSFFFCLRLSYFKCKYISNAIFTTIFYNQSHSMWSNTTSNLSIQTCFCPINSIYICNCIIINRRIISFDSINCTSHVRHKTWCQNWSSTRNSSQNKIINLHRSYDRSYLEAINSICNSSRNSIIPFVCRRYQRRYNVFFICDWIYKFSSITHKTSDCCIYNNSRQHCQVQKCNQTIAICTRIFYDIHRFWCCFCISYTINPCVRLTLVDSVKSLFKQCFWQYFQVKSNNTITIILVSQCYFIFTSFCIWLTKPNKLFTETDCSIYYCTFYLFWLYTEWMWRLYFISTNIHQYQCHIMRIRTTSYFSIQACFCPINSIYICNRICVNRWIIIFNCLNCSCHIRLKTLSQNWSYVNSIQYRIIHLYWSYKCIYYICINRIQSFTYMYSIIPNCIFTTIRISCVVRKFQYRRLYTIYYHIHSHCTCCFNMQINCIHIAWQICRRYCFFHYRVWSNCQIFHRYDLVFCWYRTIFVHNYCCSHYVCRCVICSQCNITCFTTQIYNC